MKSHWQRVIYIKGHQLRIEVDEATGIVYYDGKEVARKLGRSRLLVFTAVEDGEPVLYAIGISTGSQVRVFVGRKGELIFSSESEQQDKGE